MHACVGVLAFLSRTGIFLSKIAERTLRLLQMIWHFQSLQWQNNQDKSMLPPTPTPLAFLIACFFVRVTGAVAARDKAVSLHTLPPSPSFCLGEVPSDSIQDPPWIGPSSSKSSNWSFPEAICAYIVQPFHWELSTQKRKDIWIFSYLRAADFVKWHNSLDSW